MKGLVTVTADDLQGSSLSKSTITFPVKRFSKSRRGADGTCLLSLRFPSERFWTVEPEKEVLRRIQEAM